MNQVEVLRSGYSYEDTETRLYKANCTISYVKSKEVNIIVDTGLPRDKKFILKSLEDINVEPSRINWVVCTHGHSDHVGNLSLFPEATLVVGTDICKEDNYIDNDLKLGGVFDISDEISIIPTPGHTCHDISLVVKNTQYGVVTFAGDVFEKREDLDDMELWKGSSYNPQQQLESRIKVAMLSDFIVPGHGPGFSVDSEVRKKIEHSNLS